MYTVFLNKKYLQPISSKALFQYFTTTAEHLRHAVDIHSQHMELPLHTIWAKIQILDLRPFNISVWQWHTFHMYALPKTHPHANWLTF